MVSVEQGVDPGLVRLLDEVVGLAVASRAFASAERRGGVVHCVAAIQPDAAYEVTSEGGSVFVSWVSADRYLSQSIEADLMWTGDDLKELIEEELSDVGCDEQPFGRIEHFRDEQKRFTFRSAVSASPGGGADAALIVKCLVAFAKAFAELGDMKPAEE